MSPDGETIVTGAGDETLRFWKVFPKKVEQQKKASCVAPSFRELR
jgi:cell division cycle 20-like protein 1 (cofactor of APC complex)